MQAAPRCETRLEAGAGIGSRTGLQNRLLVLLQPNCQLRADYYSAMPVFTQSTFVKLAWKKAPTILSLSTIFSNDH